MTSQHMGYCQGGVHMRHYHVQYVRISYVGPTYIMGGKCSGLIVIDVFSLGTMHFGEIEQLLCKGEPCMDNLHSAYHRRWSGRRCRIFQKLRRNLESKLNDSLKMSTIGQNVLFSGIFRTGNINFFGIIWMSCISVSYTHLTLPTNREV